MTEAEWLACADPQALLAALGNRTSPRKLRLFGAACVRQVWHYLTDERSGAAVVAAGRFGEGEITADELAQLAQEAWEAVSDDEETPSAVATTMAWQCAYRDPNWQVFTGRAVRALAAEAPVADLLRCLFNPYHAVCPDPAWHATEVLGLARAAYEERTLPAGTLDNARLAVLADALEEAGCTDRTLLEHCRSSSLHVRGCWAVDQVLGRE
jgi:hypothetical protein